MTKIYYEQDADLNVLNGKTVAVFGYGSQGYAQANNMRDSGVKVILGLRESARAKGKQDGFETYDFPEAAEKADIIHFLVPDEHHKDIYNKIAAQVTPGKTLSCSHGFNFHFKRIVAPEGVNVIMIAPKAPGPTVRREYINGFGVPCLVAVEKNATGNAWEIVLALAKANGHLKVGALETTFREETESDLFGEQTVLCGGLVELVNNGFETLVEAGYQPELAYFECLHEVKLIVDLMYQGGIYGMMSKVSNTAKYGGYTRGKKVVTPESKQIMKKILADIQNGKFAKEFVAEKEEKAMSTLKQLHEEWKNKKIEKVGQKIRQFAKLEELKKGDEKK